MYENELKALTEKMDKSIRSLHTEFASVRTGQANASLLDRVFVDYYGSSTPITQVASVTVPQARLIVIQPWDKSLLQAIEKAILQSDLGLTPMNDGNLIRLAIPQLTEERRKELVKVVNKSDVSEDIITQAEENIQKLTDKKIKEVEEVTDKKIKEIMSV